MKLGISGQALGKVNDLEEILAILNKYDVKNIEIWPVNIPCADKSKPAGESQYEGRDISKAKEILKKHGINVACVTMPGAFDRELSSDVKQYSESLKYTVEVAMELGAKVVNHYCYYLSLDENNDEKRIIPFIEPALKKAEEYGITMVLENEAHDATRRPEGMLKILKAVNSKYFCTNYDACNYFHASQEGFPYAYDLLKSHIAYVHIKNGCVYNPEAGYPVESKGSLMTGGHAPNHIYYPVISKGAVNVDGLLLRLKSDSYEGYCVMEPHTRPELVEKYYSEDISYLRGRGFFKV